MKIIHLNKNTIDVFTGTGWNNWSRFEKTDKGVRLIKGFPVTPKEFKQILNVLSSGKTQKHK